MSKKNRKAEAGIQPAPKKKGRGLLIVLLIILIPAVLFIGIRGVGKMMENRLRKQLPGIPFVFAANDYSSYVTQDFRAETDPEGDHAAITWSSSDETVVAVGQDGFCSVTRPEMRNITVTMTAKEKFLLILTAKAEYEITVIRTGGTSPGEVYVPDEKTVESGKGPYAFTVYYTEDDKPYWIRGKLGTRVESIEDAEAVVLAYRDFFGIPDEIELRFSDMVGNEEHLFTFLEYCNGACLDGYTVAVTADENGVLTGVTASLPEELPGERTRAGQPLSEEEQDAVLAARFEEVYCLDREYVFRENRYVWQIRVLADGQFLEIEMDAFTGEILAEASLINTANVEVKGKDSLGNELTVSVSRPWSGNPGFRDDSRSIGVYYPTDSFRELKEKSEEETEEETEEEPEEESEEKGLDWFQVLLYKVFYVKKYSISKQEAVNTQALSSMYNLQKVYDWYLNGFGWKGANGRGGEILVIMDFPELENNAAQVRLGKNANGFLTGADTSDLIVGELCAYTDIMAHEYTHARFGEYSRAAAGNNEVGAINESYADIFAAFMSGKWKLADGSFGGLPARDFETMVSNPGHESETVCPLFYDELNMEDDIHVNGMLLTRCAMEMETEGLVSRSENRKIWYKAVTYGNINNLCTFLTMRGNVERAAEEIGLESETVEAIGEIFAAHRIGESKKAEVENDAVTGDVFLDDVAGHRYLMLWSPVGTAFIGTPVMIMEEKTKGGKVDEDAVSEQIGQALSASLATEGSWAASNVKNIRYTQDSAVSINMIAGVFDAQKEKIISAISDGGGDSSDSETFVDMLISCKVYECTSYEFYTRVLGIDPAELSR